MLVYVEKINIYFNTNFEEYRFRVFVVSIIFVVLNLDTKKGKSDKELLSINSFDADDTKRPKKKIIFSVFDFSHVVTKHKILKWVKYKTPDIEDTRL